MTETVIYILRQAETLPEENVKNVDWDLSEKGKIQARDLAFKLNDLDISVVYSSPYRRTISTVKPLAQKLQLPILLEDGFRELISTKEYLAPVDFQELSKKMWSDDLTYSENGAESIRECQLRFMQSLNKIAKEHAGEKIIICTHGTPLGAILKVMDKSFGYDEWTKIKMPDVYKLVSNGTEGRWDKSYQF
jgi:2,3-bisphosphoglycerate-dependent phosphoglycerate mutase